MALRSQPLIGLSLCSGIGGLELGLKLALGDAYRCGVYVEREAFAAAILVERMEESALDRAPVWDDLTTFDGRPWCGSVDIVSAGFPCQPFSVAGKRKGLDDERWIWPDIARIIREVQPRLVFLENVSGLARHGLGSVLGDLAEMGFDAEWDLFSAEETGAPQERKRLFILAYHRRESSSLSAERGFAAEQIARSPRAEMAHHDRQRIEERRRSVASEPQFAAAVPSGGELAHARCGSDDPIESESIAGSPGAACPGGDGEQLADADSKRRPSSLTSTPTRGPEPDLRVSKMADAGHGFVPIEGRRPERRTGTGSTGQDVVDSDRPREPQREGDVAGIGRRPGNTSRPLYPPGPDDGAGWIRYLVRAPGTEPSVRRNPDGTPHRVDRLRTLGNGVVPLVAAHAFLALWERLDGD